MESRTIWPFTTPHLLFHLWKSSTVTKLHCNVDLPQTFSLNFKFCPWRVGVCYLNPWALESSIQLIILLFSDSGWEISVMENHLFILVLLNHLASELRRAYLVFIDSVKIMFYVIIKIKFPLLCRKSLLLGLPGLKVLNCISFTDKALLLILDLLILINWVNWQVLELVCSNLHEGDLAGGRCTRSLWH